MRHITLLIFTLSFLPAASAAADGSGIAKPGKSRITQLPASLAGYSLGETVPVDPYKYKDSGEGECSGDRSNGSRFEHVSCKVSPKGKIYKIKANYVNPPAFDHLLEARIKKLGPPTEDSPSRENCDLPVGGEFQCAIWESESVKMVLHRFYGNLMGVPFDETGLVLGSKKIRAKAEQEARRHSEQQEKKAIDDDRRRAEEVTRDE